MKYDRVWIERLNYWVLDVPMYEIHDVWTGGSSKYVRQEEQEITEWLQYCFEQMDGGNESLLQPDPFYTRANGKPSLTDEEVDKVIAGIDAEFEFEKKNSLFHHTRNTGAVETPDFFRLGPAARRCVVEGCDAIIQKWDKWYWAKIREMVRDGVFSTHNSGKAPPEEAL